MVCLRLNHEGIEFSIVSFAKVLFISREHGGTTLKIASGVVPAHAVFTFLIRQVGQDSRQVHLALIVTLDFLKVFVSLEADDNFDSSLLPQHACEESPVVHHAKWYLLISYDYTWVLYPLLLVLIEYYVLALNLIIEFL